MFPRSRNEVFEIAALDAVGRHQRERHRIVQQVGESDRALAATTIGSNEFLVLHGLGSPISACSPLRWVWPRRRYVISIT
jgi:hypothetical protein